MQILIDIKPALASLEQIAAMKSKAIQAGADSVYNYLRDYHSKMDWRGSHWMPGPNSGEFAKSVVEGWQPPVITGNTVTITNTFGLLSWKITGGTISPRSARYLTIPLIPTAKNVGARNFEDSLFVAGRALCRKIGQKLEAIYALSSGVTQAPWPGALPPEEVVANAFMDGFLTSFKTNV